jgi:cytochrome c
MRELVGAAALVLAFALAACSPAESPAPAPVAPAAEPAPAAATTEVAGQTIALAITDASGTQYSGDTARGQTVFKKCTQCHSVVEGKNGTGPSLYGILGRLAGTAPNFRYSEANKTSGIMWTEQALFDYLENPKETIPKTIMAFVGLPKAQDRADVVAYLKAKAQP